MLLRILAIVVLTGCTAPLPGADFSGTWKLALAKSDFGKANPPQALTMQVRQTRGQLEVESTLVDARGESVSKYTLDLSGHEAENMMRGNKVVSVTSWRGEVLHVKAKTSVQGTEVKTVDQWQLEEEGKVLTVYRTATTPNAEIEQKFVYEKHLGTH